MRSLRVVVLGFLAFLNAIPANPVPGAAGLQAPSPAQLPSELRGAKVYKLSEDSKSGQTLENPVIYRDISYQDLNFERLALNLAVSVKPVDRAAMVQRVFFQDVRVNGVPLHVETFDKPFKLSKSEVVDLPAPLKCSIVFAELDSFKPVQEIVNQDKLLVTGQSYIEVKLSAIEKIALRTKQLVIPSPVYEEVPLHMFSDSPLLKMAASKIVDTLADPTSTAALALAKRHVEKLRESKALDSLARPGLYFLYCEFALTDPKTKAQEKFNQTGTGFVVSADGKLLTAKQVVQPWKFDPAIAFLMQRYHLEIAPDGYKLCAWPVGASVLSADGKLDFQPALCTDKQALKILKTGPDQPQAQDYQDPDSGERAALQLEPAGANDFAVLQLRGGDYHPLTLADATQAGSGSPSVLFGFPFGLSHALAVPNPSLVKASLEGTTLNLEHTLNPGESGAPLLTPEGKVVALAAGANHCIPIEAARSLIP